MSDRIIFTFSGRYARTGRIWRGCGQCTVCGKQDVPVIGMNSSGASWEGIHDGNHDGDGEQYEYSSGYICLACAFAAFGNVTEDVIVIPNEMREEYERLMKKVKEAAPDLNARMDALYKRVTELETPGVVRGILTPDPLFEAMQKHDTGVAQDYHAPRGCCGSCRHFHFECFYELEADAFDNCNTWAAVDGWKDTCLGAEPKEVLETESVAEKPLPNYCVNCTAWEPIPTESGICTEKKGMITGRSHECDLGYRQKEQS